MILRAAAKTRSAPTVSPLLSVHRNQWDGSGTGLPSCQLPFFYEYDRGSKNTTDVARQLLSYHLLALSRKALERFPDLNVEGYAIPTLMVFSDRSRLRNTHKEFLRSSCGGEATSRCYPSPGR